MIRHNVSPKGAVIFDHPQNAEMGAWQHHRAISPASTVENYLRLADHVIGKLGAVKGQGPGGPAGAEGPGRAVGIAVDPLAAAASAQHQADKIARTREQLHWQAAVDRRAVA